MTKVSVIIPTHNRKGLLRETINSVLKQTFKEFEIIVIDDGSTDGTSEMLRTVYGDAVRCVVIAHSGLPAVARNAGIQAAEAPYLAFLDSDDLWVPDKLERQLKALEENPKYGWSYGNVACFGPSHSNQELLYGNWRIRSGNIFQKLFTGNFVPTSTVVVRASSLRKAGIFDISPGLRAAEDYELWLRLAWYFPAYAIPTSLALYRMSRGGISHGGTFNAEPGFNAVEMACRKLNPPARLQRKAKAALRLASFREAARNNPEAALQWLHDSCRLDPGNLRAWWYRLLLALGGLRGFFFWLSLERRMKLLLSPRSLHERSV